MNLNIYLKKMDIFPHQTTLNFYCRQCSARNSLRTSDKHTLFQPFYEFFQLENWFFIYPPDCQYPFSRYNKAVKIQVHIRISKFHVPWSESRDCTPSTSVRTDALVVENVGQDVFNLVQKFP